MTQDRLIWFKGDLVPAAAAQVSILSPTAQFGLNVFEGLRGYWDGEDVYLFRLQDHLDRLRASCRLMGLVCPYDDAQITEAIKATLRANAYRCDIAVRVTLFVDGEGSWANSDPVEMSIAPIAKARRDPNAPGLRACVSTWERIDDRSMPPRVKAGANYINGRYAHLEAQANGYDLPILLDRAGQVAEGAGACIMIVRDGVLITPPGTASILESITRATLLELAEGPCEVRAIDRTELYLADEAFLCGSAAEVTPLTAIDRYDLGPTGPVTADLAARYFAATTRADWATPLWGAA